MSHPYLEWPNEDNQIKRLEIIDKVYIGRTCKGVDANKRVLLHSPLISRNHAEITRTAAHLQITDTSKNGTWVNGTRIAAGPPKDLKDGDVIIIGKSSFRVSYPKITADGAYNSTSTESTIIDSAEVDVTSLVADIKGFSAFSQTHTSSEVYNIVKAIFDEFNSIVDQFKGTIKDYAGDAVFAFWDHQIEIPTSQAVQACQAAIQQTLAFDRLLVKITEQYRGVEDLQMGWGITTGTVTISHYGARVADLAIVGDCINLAFRLSDIANKEVPEKIVICAQTAELVRNELTVKNLGMFSIRGRIGEEHVFALD